MNYKKLIKKIKKFVRKASYPPSYNLSKWEEKSFNCYIYALDLCANINLDGYCIAPGFFSRGQENDYDGTEENTIKYFKDDCEVLNLNVLETAIDEKIAKKEYKIALYVSKNGDDFHFVRQDSNGKGYKYIGVYRVSKKG